jgi:hypothetical protein
MGHHYRRAMRVYQGLPPDGETSEEDEQQVLAAYANGLLAGAHSQAKRSRYSVKRIVVKRNIREGWHRLRLDYFDPHKVYPDAFFRRR